MNGYTVATVSLIILAGIILGSIYLGAVMEKNETSAEKCKEVCVFPTYQGNLELECLKTCFSNICNSTNTTLLAGER